MPILIRLRIRIHFDANSDLDWQQNNTGPYVDSNLGFAHVTFTAMLLYIVLSFSSLT